MHHDTLTNVQELCRRWKRSTCAYAPQFLYIYIHVHIFYMHVFSPFPFISEESNFIKLFFVFCAYSHNIRNLLHRLLPNIHIILHVEKISHGQQIFSIAAIYKFFWEFASPLPLPLNLLVTFCCCYSLTPELAVSSEGQFKLV